MISTLSDSFFKNIKYKIIYREKNACIIQVNIKDFTQNGVNWENLLWSKNRPINDDKVLDIVEVIQSNFSNDISNIENSKIFIGTVNGYDPRILDGQHRLKSWCNLHSSDQLNNHNLLITVTDYKCEKMRVNDFIRINSNTPLGDYYKDDEMYTKYISNMMANKIYNNILLKTGQNIMFVTAVDSPYKITLEGLKCKIYKELKMYEMKSEQAYFSLIDKITNLMYDKSFFSDSTPSQYPRVATINKQKCLAQKIDSSNKYSVKNKAITEIFTQCNREPHNNSEFCHIHLKNKLKFSPVLFRMKMFDHIKQNNMNIFFILHHDYEWLSIIFTKLFLYQEDNSLI